MWINLEIVFFFLILKEQSQSGCHIFKTEDILRRERKLES